MQPIIAQDDLLVNQQKLMLIAVVWHIVYSFSIFSCLQHSTWSFSIIISTLRQADTSICTENFSNFSTFNHHPSLSPYLQLHITIQFLYKICVSLNSVLHLGCSIKQKMLHMSHKSIKLEHPNLAWSCQHA
jgi:hypothetical protein